ncbi:MAG TPA: antitoxin Xre/MbcA/ParS toxin-binding domain-containing protein [Terriglobales bacterium]|nr:antitoxin Xre/MbcA/ParS toxin-binding domain-containing protein [Terriglobales bacterium]
MASVGIAVEMGPTAAAVVEVLGGAERLGRPIRNAAELRAAIREGLPTASLQALAERLALDRDTAAIAFGITPRTLSRRLSGQERLTPLESDRVARVARLFSSAIATLGEESKAAAWLRTPNRALNGETPLGQLDTDPGTSAVEAVLGRIALGGYS